MKHWPFKIENGVGDNENKRRVLQDVESTVGGDMSQLPDEILEYILNKLMLRDAVRASLVSSTWRNLVLSRPCLIFKTCSMFEIEGASEEKCVCSEYKDRFVRAVYDFLASYRSARMKKLSVHFCLKIVSRNALSDWMRFACDFGVEDVALNFYCEYFKSEVRPCRPRSTRLLKVSPSKQPIVLKYLSLSCSKAFTVSLFTQLETLNLDRVSLDSYVMESVLSSGLVNLKTLRFKYSELPPYISLYSLPNLQHFLACFCLGLQKIDVASLKLNTLEVNCKGEVSFGLTQVPNLKVFSNSLHASPKICYIFSKLPQILPHLTTLQLFSSYNWVEYMPESIATFSNLESLQLPIASEEDVMVKIVQFLKSCPVLSNLSIVLDSRPERDKEHHKEHEKLECNDDDDYCHEHLEWITIYGFGCTKNQIEFCKYLLKLAPHAKQLKLNYFRGNRKERQMNEEQCEIVVNALKPFLKNVKLLL